MTFKKKKRSRSEVKERVAEQEVCGEEVKGFSAVFDSDQAAVGPQAATWLMLHEGTNTKSFDFREGDSVCFLN